MEHPGLGRRHAPDPRDAAYPLRALLPSKVPARASRYYRTGQVLDQGQSPECVAFAWKQWLDSAPIMDKVAVGPTSDVIYKRAQQLDEWEGENYEGTSVRAGAKVIAELGQLGAYHWSQSAEDVRAYLLTSGTVVFGTDWTEDMFKPDVEGFVKPTGSTVGGHAYLCIGFSSKQGAFRFINSWGGNWGRKGRFWMSGESVDELLRRDGEACAGVEVRVA